MRNISKYIVLIALVCLIAVGIILIVRRTRISNHTPDFKMGSPYIDIENREDLSKFLKIDFDEKRLVDVEYIIDEDIYEKSSFPSGHDPAFPDNMRSFVLL